MTRKAIFNRPNTTIEFDPINEFDLTNLTAIAEACGILPQFAEVAGETPEQFMESVIEQYGFGDYPMDGFTVDERGTMTYADDPPLKPIARITCNADPSVGMDIYRHAWVRFFPSNAVHRLD